MGKKVSALPSKELLDLDVETDVTGKHSHVVRVVTRYNPNAEKDSKRVILRTNLPRHLVCLDQLFNLYRIRWSIEIVNKCLKSGCALAPINSTNKNIVIQVFLFSFIAAMIKVYTALKAMKGKDYYKVSQLKLFCAEEFKKLVMTIATREKSTIYQIFKELTEFVKTRCLRGAPSQRDKDRLKDLPLLVWDIVSSPDFKLIRA